ncbi:MAG: CatA-like O-acetyltransferase [Flavobacteriaceae bacterium]|nr:CatA-like O-acetyltransferase [Flavobacteriaceae bacterium]
MKKIDLDNWKRKVHFQFFKNFDEPFHSLTFTVDVTHALQHAKKKNISFFNFYTHACLRAVNALEGFKYRIKNNEVYLCEQVNISATLPKGDGTFRFSYVEFHTDFKKFNKRMQAEKLRIQTQETLFPPRNDDAVIHFSALPWVSFTALTHARDFSIRDSVPKISVGGLCEANGKTLMPVSVTVHHALADGNDIGLFKAAFEQFLQLKES